MSLKKFKLIWQPWLSLFFTQRKPTQLL